MKVNIKINAPTERDYSNCGKSYGGTASPGLSARNSIVTQDTHKKRLNMHINVKARESLENEHDSSVPTTEMKITKPPKINISKAATMPVEEIKITF